MADQKNNNVVGQIILTLTNEGIVFINHDEIPEINVRINMLQSALDVEKKLLNDMFATDENGNLYS